MIGRLGKYYALFRAETSPRAAVIKIKINGRCVNECAFCPFHDDPRKLEVEDLARFFDLIEAPRYWRIDINGGEPSIHPRFAAICDFLRDRFKGRSLLYLGSNLIPLARDSGGFRKRFEKVLDTFDVVSVGCDDEHRNIDSLERLAPEIVQSGRLLFVNVMEDYCSAPTRKRILALQEHLGLRVTYSRVHHFYQGCPRVNDTAVPCRRRVKELLINCNGDAFFCFHQEMEEPLFNLSTVTREQLNFYLDEFLPEPYRFCAACPCYRPAWTALARSGFRDLFAARPPASNPHP